MTVSDEEEFSASLLQRSLRIRFVDDNIWPQPAPRVARSISECQSRYVFIWDPMVVAELPIIRRLDGNYQGPQSGAVIEFSRSSINGDEMLSGRIAVGFDEANTHMKEFVSTVWEVFIRSTETNLTNVAGEPVPNYRIGHDALHWVLGKPGRKLRDRGTVTAYFFPKQLIQPSR